MLLTSDLKTRDPSMYGGCILIIGMMLLISLYATYMTQSRLTGVATGTVIELRQRSGKDKGYYSVVQFLTSEDLIYSFESTLSSNLRTYKVGDQVEVLYDPEFPGEAAIASDNGAQSNPMMWFFGAGGVIFVLTGFYLIGKKLRQKFTAHHPIKNAHW